MNDGGQMARKPADEDRIGRVERDSPGRSSLAERIRQQQLEGLRIQRPAGESEREEAPDKYRQEGRLPHFLDSVSRRIGTGYRQFKLPGTDYVVRDLRDADTGGESAKKDSAYEMKDGRLAEARQKSYVNYLGERQVLQPEVAKDAGREISRLLSEFEKLLVDRFEKGRTVERESEDGEPHFREKTAEEWRSFFSRFLGRAAWRKAGIETVRQFIYRGLVALKKGDGVYAMLIGDMAMSDGQVQKFARLKVLSQLMGLLAGMKPGSGIEPELLKKGLTADELMYLALAHRHGERALRLGQEATKGIFGQLRTEEHVAEQLGLHRRKKGGKGYGGPIKWGEKDSGEERHAFVPWGFWEREKRGRPWGRVFTYVTATIIVLLALAAVWALVNYFS